MRTLTLVLALAASLAVAACDASETPPPASDGAVVAVDPSAAALASLPPADPAAVAAVASAIDAADPADPATLAALDVARFTDGAAEAAAATLADSGADVNARWAAVLVYSTDGDDPAVLRPFLGDPDASVRASAAMTLLVAGERDAIDTLVALTGSGERLRGSVPPMAIGRWVADGLAAALDPTMGAPDAQGDAAATAWSAWLQVHGRSLAFDPATGTWSTK